MHTEQSGIRGTLLVVEDDLVNQKVAALTLERHGYVVEVAADGALALDALAARSYDAVLMDCQMPVMDGYAATRELRRREAGGRRTPVIALTASAMTEDRDRCAAAGMDDYVAKPIDVASLLTVLRRWTGAPEPLLDAAVVAELDGLGEGVRDELTALFARDAAQRLGELSTATSPDASATAAHALRGASQAVGAAAVTTRAGQIETRARRGEQPVAAELDALRADVDAALAALASTAPSG